jgi:hypothetical protein
MFILQMNQIFKKWVIRLDDNNNLILFSSSLLYVLCGIASTDFYVLLMWNYLVKTMTTLKSMWLPREAITVLKINLPVTKIYILLVNLPGRQFHCLCDVILPVPTHSQLITKCNVESFVCGARISGYYCAGLTLLTSLPDFANQCSSHTAHPPPILLNK